MMYIYSEVFLITGSLNVLAFSNCSCSSNERFMDTLKTSWLGRVMQAMAIPEVMQNFFSS